MYRILVSDPLEATGLAMLRDSGHEVHELSAEDKPRLAELISEFDALVVRSGTTVTEEILQAGAPRLKVVGRAGIGVDNVDIPAATRLGILVINAPTANLLSATEHTFALMLAVARNVGAADRSVKEGVWDRKKFVGAELQGKTLGVVGFGRIGRQVALRGRAFDMNILAYDPFLDADRVRRENAEPRELDDLLAEADVVTLHVPLTADTRGLLSGDRLRKMKKGAILVNCARGGVVDETTLLELLNVGHLSGAGLDVFEVEPPTDFTLAAHPRVVATPHLGAQTREAQVRISTDTAKMVLEALRGSLAVTAVNLPFRDAGSGASREPFLRLAEKLGFIAGALRGGRLKRVCLTLRGFDSELHEPMAVAALKGAFSKSHGASVNYVNAEHIAREAGIEVVRATSSDDGHHPTLATLLLEGEEGSFEISGTVFQDREARVVRLGAYQLEFMPKGVLLVIRNRDVPGVVGNLGTILGTAAVNIAEIHLSRRQDLNLALAVARIDEAPSSAVLEVLRQVEEVESVDLIDLGPI